MVSKKDPVSRCPWSTRDDEPLYIEYHDHEWGVPVHDEKRIYEFLVLEGAQAGLSWLTILRRRTNYRSAFDGFDPETVANYGPKRVEELMGNVGIIRNRLKIVSAIQNAKCLLKVKEEFGSFDRYIWSFVPKGEPRKNRRRRLSEIPARTKESDALSGDLRRRGFTFVGSTICYAHMQATGMVNDHLVSCFRHEQV